MAVLIFCIVIIAIINSPIKVDYNIKIRNEEGNEEIQKEE